MAGGKKILVVDDNPDAIEFVKAVISGIGDYSVITATDGNQGLAKAQAESPDLIILDVMMPVKDGFMVFADFRKNPETMNIPVIMLTGVSEETGSKFGKKDMGKFIGQEPEEFIDKPVDPIKLQEIVKKILDE